MKDFMMIFIGAPYDELGLSPEQLQSQMGKWFAWNDKMQSQGILRGGNALHSKAKRITSDRTLIDGPFVEGKELVGGYYIISAKDENEVAKVAEDYPDYEYGGIVEISEVMVFDQ